MNKQSVKPKKPVIARATFNIEGVSPLFCDRFDPDWLINPQPKDKTHEAQFEDSIYWTTDKRYGFPAKAVKSCLANSARFTAKKINALKSLLFIIEQDIQYGLLYLDTDEPKMQVDAIRLPRGTKQISVCSSFWPWAMTFAIEFDQSQITIEEVKLQVEIAGELIGLGYRRVESGDNRRLGRFKII